MIAVVSLSKRFGNLWALNDLNLSIKKGEFYCLLGPNGAGKTTTLKILTGLMRPTRGSIYINGLDIEKDYLKVKRILGLIPDTGFMYDNLTALEFLTFIGNIFGIKQEILKKKINYYFDLFGLNECRLLLIRELSHGMRQKIIYISNFIHEPLVYLIDEPLIGLDPASIHLLKKLLKQEVEKGKAILMSTHILSIAEELADRIGILHEGVLIAEGNLNQLKEKASAETLEEVFLRLTQKL